MANSAGKIKATAPPAPVAPGAAPQEDRSRADFAVLLEFVIFCPLYSDGAAFPSYVFVARLRRREGH